MAYQDVLRFWFDQLAPEQWWQVDPAIDALVCDRFLPQLQQAAQAELHGWRETAQGRLAEIIVLDKFSRHVYRDTAAAFAQDPMALVLAQEAVRAGALETLAEAQRVFLLMPYMHSESRAIHTLAETFFRIHAPEDNYAFELKHKAIIDRFGRYPHRNRILGRASSDEERAFLQEPGSSF